MRKIMTGRINRWDWEGTRYKQEKDVQVWKFKQQMKRLDKNISGRNEGGVLLL
jgi:hypothetical protein